MTAALPTVFVVDDDASVRRAVERLLRSAGMAVRTYGSAHEYFQTYDPSDPGCLVLDLEMPDCDGLELQQALLKLGSAPAIVFLTGRAEVLHSVEAMKRGASEFLTKPIVDSLLIDAVNGAIEKDRVERARRGVVDNILSRVSTLTRRELEVLHHVVSGQLNKQIAYDLGTVEKTIKVHRARIMEKMHVRSVAELVTLTLTGGVATPAVKLVPADASQY